MSGAKPPEPREYRRRFGRRRGRLSSRAIPAEDERESPMDPLQMRSPRPLHTRDPLLRRRSLLVGQVPYLAHVRAPSTPSRPEGPGKQLEVATYNVHRWSGTSGGRRFVPELACEVVREVGADVVALQEVLRPFDRENPLDELAEELHYHLAFVSTRIHRHGELGNAILSRWPMTGIFTIDLSFGRMERRSAVVAQFHDDSDAVAVVATHLALVDRTRKLQVESILGHRHLQGPVVLLGDMNAWRRCKATRQLDAALAERHDNRRWPPSFPSARPVMALDRVYARGARVAELRVHATPAARRGSDHLPVVAQVELD
jgi:endonuclease/exonuclease/phosphatase family metal-dependent hydrolase